MPAEIAETLRALRSSPEDLGLMTDPGEMAGFLADATRRKGPAPAVVIRPKTVAGVSAALSICHRAGQPVALQGGLTGLSGGARPRPGEIVLSLARMTGLEEADPEAMTIVAEAGVTLAAIHERADAAGLFFGVDFGARGSATIGGAIATNAGGIRVLRYGMFREQVAGLEAVLADGTIVSSMRGLAKDNTGLDLRHLAIGTEGIFAVVTRARLKLHPVPSFTRAALLALASPDDALRLLGHMRRGLGPMLSAFEGIWPESYEGAAGLCGVTPLRTGVGLYVLAEMQGFGSASRPEAFEDLLMEAFEAGLCSDIVVSQSGRDYDNLWRLREACPEFTFSLGRLRGHDISLPPIALPGFVKAAKAMIAERDPAALVNVYGHLGDGNLHFTVLSEEIDALSPAIYRMAAEAGGSVSAEHGLGVDKAPYLGLVRSADEIALMRRIKGALDPGDILNPGRVITAEDGA